MALKHANRVKMTTATTGTGTITLGSAVSGYQTFAGGGVANADTVKYLIEDGANWEIGTGTYTSSGTTLARSVIESTNADAAINLSGSATVSIIVEATHYDTLAPSVAASQAEQETGSSTTVFVSPGTQQYHPSAAKFWVKATGNSTTIVASYNMTSWADTNVGDADGTIATDFSSANWCGSVSVLDSTSAWDGTYTTGCGFNAQAAGTFGVLCSRMQENTADGSTLQDPDSWHVVGFGDQ